MSSARDHDYWKFPIFVVFALLCCSMIVPLISLDKITEKEGVVTSIDYVKVHRVDYSIITFENGARLEVPYVVAFKTGRKYRISFNRLGTMTVDPLD